LLFQQSTWYKISRLLGNFNIRTVHIPTKKNSHIQREVKDDLWLKVSGVHSIPCKCGKVCRGQRGGSIKTRCKEHEWHLHLYQPDKSAVAEHNTELGHRLKFNDTEVLAKHQATWTNLSKKQQK
jgi:hypothetical protein